MNRETFENIERMSLKVGHIMIATADKKGLPHIAAATMISPVSDREVHVDGWFCERTEQNLRENPKIALVVWDREFDHGYQLLGESSGEKDIAIMDGYSPEMEEVGNFPQFERELYVKVTSILEFKHAIHNDREKAAI
jgi:uncharacterized protein